MKKQTLLLTLFILLGFSKANCQTPDWVWARSAQSNSSGIGEGYSISTDKSNNVYITGYYVDSITFGSFILTTTANANFYLTKYDSSGNVIWAKSSVSSSNGYCIGYNICTDPFGNVYATGIFVDTVSFGSYTLTGAGSENVFLVKYDSAGNVLWARSAIGVGDNYGYQVSADLSGNIYVTGTFTSSTIAFGSYVLTNVAGYDIFIAKYDSFGNVIWAKRFGNNGDEVAYSIGTDALANLYVTGYFTSPSITFGSYTLTNTGLADIFLAKFDSFCNVLWAKSVSGTDNDFGYYLVADSLGNIYITGYYFSQSITFGSFTLNNQGAHDAFLAKYDSSGNVGWVKNIGGIGNQYGYCVAMDDLNKVYVIGSFYSASVTIDTIVLQRPVVYDDPMFIAGCDSSGHLLWAKALGSGGDDDNSVAASTSGCIYVGGDFMVNSFYVGNDTLVLSGNNENAFVAKLCYPQIGESVPEISINKEFILYPNPFDDKLTASPLTPLQGRGEEEELTLFDVFGRVLLRRLFTNSATINTEQLARGIYFYEVRDKDGVGARGKIIKN